ncbi:unnamed protein product [Cyprideis torosa]|uniref:GMP synthase [glutamine-hydrolyzing] n=1 Tax=Cyprideis torosa TaxID=163714 RepID=A0A7R8ZZ46_9CRUS|nr:unnamed protein product [Cyprideis torosa]CAG0909236.1 unnamed protein product [Cyprideis torosa]
MEEIMVHQPAGIIISGGPASVFAEEAHGVADEIWKAGIPILGICYGMQLCAHKMGGVVSKGVKGEYGRSELKVESSAGLLKQTESNFPVWMSHFDEVQQAPQGFEVTAYSENAIAVLENKEEKIYTVQFHPEVTHTQFGSLILENFVFDICDCARNWKMGDWVQQQIAEIKAKVGDKKVILGLSGGVDSSVAAVLIHRAIGDQLTCIFVDTGLLRKNEGDLVMHTYGEHFHIPIVRVNAGDRFLRKLEGVDDPERKRKIIGNEFIEVFDEEAQRIEGVSFLAQGTIYPDVIESTSTGGPSAVIKSHHNVGGLPEKMNLELLEPLRELFKDEVRKVGEELGIPHDLIYRHPFPGPGLGIRILGAVSPEKVKILQEADAIFIEELRDKEFYDKVSQAFVVLLPVKSVGVMGDERTYEYTAVVRSADTIDFMTATWSKFPYEFLEKVSNRIINEVKGINRVAYDISSKPPATIEWE